MRCQLEVPNIFKAAFDTQLIFHWLLPESLQTQKICVRSSITTMKPTSLVYLITYLTTALALPGSAPISERDAESDTLSPISDRNAEPGSLLEKRACSYTTGCRSVGSGSEYWEGAGKYCGFCYQVDGLHDWVGGHIYQ